MLWPPEHFRHFTTCPRCGAPAEGETTSLPFRCARCGFVLFFNAASAVAAFIRRDDGRVLFTRREKDPAAGKLGLPGGFVDFEETAEAALRREVREEIGVEITEPRYLASFPNKYAYLGVTYHTLDLFFEAGLAQGAQPRALDAIESLHWLDPCRVDPDEVAFASMREAVLGIRAGRILLSAGEPRLLHEPD